MLSGSLQLKSPGLKCPPTFKTIALNSSTKKGPATWTHLTSIIIVFSSSFTTNFANFWIRLQYFNFLIIITGKRKIFTQHTKNNNLLFICLSGQNSAHIPEEFSVHLLFGSENFKNPQNLSALFCYKVDILKSQGRDWSAIQLCIKYPLHKQSENP